MRLRIAIVALCALTTLAIPSIARAQKPAPVAPSQLLAQREELGLTPDQVRELQLLSAQVRRFQRALLLAPSKPWIVGSKGTSRHEASERALAVLSPAQRDRAREEGAVLQELAAETGQSLQETVLPD